MASFANTVLTFTIVSCLTGVAVLSSESFKAPIPAWLSDAISGYSPCEKWQRPGALVDGESPDVVHLSTEILQIVHFDLKRQTLELSLAHTLQWHDPRFEQHHHSPALDEIFNATAQSDVVAIQAEAIWRPDIQITNALEDEGSFICNDKNRFVRLHANGSLSLRCKQLQKISCRVAFDEETGYPQKLQNCSIAYGSQVYGGNELSLFWNEQPQHTPDDKHDENAAVAVAQHQPQEAESQQASAANEAHATPSIVKHPCWSFVKQWKPDHVSAGDKCGHDGCPQLILNMQLQWETTLPMCMNL